MDFKGHAIGGALTSLALVGGLHMTGALDFKEGFLVRSNGSFAPSGQAWLSLKLFGLSFFMSLFPDLDTDSIVKRWYYRFALAAALILVFLEQPDSALSLLLLSLLPLLDKHRGWTHWKISPLLLASAFPFACELLFGNGWRGFGRLFADVFEQRETYQLFFCAILTGHYTHLLLDSKIFREK